MGIIIDSFGLINSPKSPITLFKVIGLTLVMLGVIISTKVSKSEIIEDKIKANFLWKILVVSSGMLMSLQCAIYALVHAWLVPIIGTGQVVRMNIVFILSCLLKNIAPSLMIKFFVIYCKHSYKLDLKNIEYM